MVGDVGMNGFHVVKFEFRGPDSTTLRDCGNCNSISISNFEYRNTAGARDVSRANHTINLPAVQQFFEIRNLNLKLN